MVTVVEATEMRQQQIPMQHQGSNTFYVESLIHGSEPCMMLLDTGSGHTVINKTTLKQLKASGRAEFIKQVEGIMADGGTTLVPLYRIDAITIGDACTVRDVEVAVLPHSGRQILGISTLQKAAPFEFSFDPPTLNLKGCQSAVTVAGDSDLMEAAVIETNSHESSPRE